MVPPSCSDGRHPYYPTTHSSKCSSIQSHEPRIWGATSHLACFLPSFWGPSCYSKPSAGTRAVPGLQFFQVWQVWSDDLIKFTGKLWNLRTCEPNQGGCVREGSTNKDFCEPNTILNRRLAKYHRPLRTFEARLWTRWQGGLARRHRGLSRIAAGRRFDWRPVGDESKPKHGRKKQGKTDSRVSVMISIISFQTKLSTDVIATWELLYKPTAGHNWFWPPCRFCQVGWTSWKRKIWPCSASSVSHSSTVGRLLHTGHQWLH